MVFGNHDRDLPPNGITQIYTPPENHISKKEQPLGNLI